MRPLGTAALHSEERKNPMAVQQEAVVRPGAFLETASLQALSTLPRDHKRHGGPRRTRLMEK